MKNNTFIYLLFFFVVSINYNCFSDDDVTLIDPELEEYMIEFQIEAATRGVLINYDETPIYARFSDFQNNQILGSCQHRIEEPNLVAIDEVHWQTMDDLEREYVMYHELGHCILDRGHFEAVLADNICGSIMASGTGSCLPNYTDDTKAFYLDELFLN